ncbi:hypothetical protein H4582DRAFT_2052809 [Lactarius indigo]|nr:hypothetical protein H4582DRAFT_2052809 [Lactarius indigo]
MVSTSFLGYASMDHKKKGVEELDLFKDGALCIFNPVTPLLMEPRFWYSVLSTQPSRLAAKSATPSTWREVTVKNEPNMIEQGSPAGHVNIEGNEAAKPEANLPAEVKQRRKTNPKVKEWTEPPRIEGA